MATSERVLGSTTSNSDTYPHEINSFDDAPLATETTSLLNSTTPKLRAKPRTDGSRSFGSGGDPPSFHRGYDATADTADLEEAEVIVIQAPAGTGGRPDHSRPILLKLSFGFSCLLLFANLSVLILTILSINSPVIANNALPPHFGSTFLPIHLSLLSLLSNSLSLLSFAFPNESPKLSAITNYISSFFVGVTLILISAVTLLRREESLLTIVTLALAFISTIHSGFSSLLVERYSDLLLPPPPRRVPLSELGFTASLLRVLSTIFSFLSISLPLVIVHVAIAIWFGMLMLNVILRAYDTSLELEEGGQVWKVDPWKHAIRNDLGENINILPELGNGRPYRVHLTCKGSEVDPIIHDQNPLSFSGAEATMDNASLYPPQARTRRTVLMESQRGVSGVTGADWVLEMLKRGDLISPDVEVRVCYWDRPGYGFSDNSPSASVPHLVTALTQALSLSGELSRLTSVLPSSSTLPKDRYSSGFILVADGYGALLSTSFAATHPELVHSSLYLNPIPPSLHYASSTHWSLSRRVSYFFTSVVYKSIVQSELGISRIWFTIFHRSSGIGTSRFARRYSSESSGIRGAIRRSFIQEGNEANNPSSRSAKSWERKKNLYPRNRPSIVLTASPQDRPGYTEGYTEEEWSEATKNFVVDVVGRGLLKWSRDFRKGSKEEERALLDLIHAE